MIGPLPMRRCRWGLAYASGPYPNVVTGSARDPFPVFTPKAAGEAEVGRASGARSSADIAGGGSPGVG